MVGRLVVRYDIHQEPHVEPPQLGGQPLERLDPAQLGAHPPRVAHCVAVRAPTAGGQDRRQVQVADPEVAQVRQRPAGVVEGERRRELEAVAGGREPHAPAGSLVRVARMNERPTRLTAERETIRRPGRAVFTSSSHTPAWPDSGSTNRRDPSPPLKSSSTVWPETGRPRSSTSSVASPSISIPTAFCAR